MQPQVLRVGETLVMDEDICLTVLAVEGDSVLLGVTAPGPIDLGSGTDVGWRRPRLMPTPTPFQRSMDRQGNREQPADP